jgi:hypothetical protein
MAIWIVGGDEAASLAVHYLGEWRTPFWVGDDNKRELTRVDVQGILLAAS